MNALEYILDGLEAELALERELGARSFEFDRALLLKESGKVALPIKPGSASAPALGSAAPTEPLQPSVPLAFLHDKALSPAGIEMLAKIIAAMKLTAEQAPIVLGPPFPRARVLVVMGGRALQRFFPNLKAAPGMWLTTDHGTPILVTYSPEYILRFTTVTPAVQKMKADMWRDLKLALRRAEG